MRRRGRPVLGAISGFFFGLFLGVTLLSFGVLPLNSALLSILPLLGFVAGLVLAFTAPIPRRGASAPPGP
jgi:hypothetical protein